MSNGEAPFRTKMTIGLFTIEPCPQNDPNTTINHVEYKSPEVLAVEQAARDQIAAKKAARKNRSKSGSRDRKTKKPSRSQSSDGLPTSKEKRKGKKPQLPARSKTDDNALEEARKKALEEKEAAERARKKAEEEEEARRKAAEEVALLKAEEEERLKEEEEARLAEEMARLTAEEEAELEAAAAAMLAENESLAPAEPTRQRPRRRVSMFPCAAKGDEDLKDAIHRYGNNAPFEWEKPEWRKEHVNLRHTSRINNMYGWEKPEWATKNMLRKTSIGERVKKGEKLEKGITHVNVNKRVSLTRRHSMTGRTVKIPSKGSIQWHVPLWAKKKILRKTEFGEAARLGMSLEIPVNFLRNLASGQSEEEAMQNSGLSNSDNWHNSFASLSASKRDIAWEKPSWAVEPKLKTTEQGMAVRQGANLALPVTELKVLQDPLDESSRTLGESFSHLKASHLNASQRKIAWEKPVWATSQNLKRTSKGEKMKQAGNLAAPIAYGYKN